MVLFLAGVRVLRGPLAVRGVDRVVLYLVVVSSRWVLVGVRRWVLLYGGVL